MLPVRLGMDERPGMDDRPEVTVLYRDERCLVVNKPSGLVVHRGWARERVVVQTLVRDAIGQRVNPVHRLDRGTSGALVFALDREATRLLMEAFADGEIEKEYLALARNTPPESGTIDHAIPRSEKGPRVDAVTDFERLAVLDHCSLVRARPRTGRLHQIRRHFRHLGHPLLGDKQYGRGWTIPYFAEHYGLERLALHAHRLRFRSPDGPTVDVTAPLPPDLTTVLTTLGAPLPTHD